MRAFYAIMIILGLLAITMLVPGCGAGQISATCFPTISTSSEAPPHSHMWCVGAAYTKNYCDKDGVCHKHKINESANLAEPAGIGPHTHVLQ
jgi:hypothetical protein